MFKCSPLMELLLKQLVEVQNWINYHDLCLGASLITSNQLSLSSFKSDVTFYTFSRQFAKLYTLFWNIFTRAHNGKAVSMWMHVWSCLLVCGVLITWEPLKLEVTQTIVFFQAIDFLKVEECLEFCYWLHAIREKVGRISGFTSVYKVPTILKGFLHRTFVIWAAELAQWKKMPNRMLLRSMR